MLINVILFVPFPLFSKKSKIFMVYLCMVSGEKRERKFNEIIEAGKRLVTKYGARGLNLRALAKELNTLSQTGLYRYVESKRELWFAIRFSYYRDYLNPFNKIVSKHQGSYKELFLKFVEFFLEFASQDFHRFEVMFLLSAPKSKKIGEIEKRTSQFTITKALLSHIKDAIDAKEIEETGAVKNFYYILGIVIGAAKMEADIKDHFVISEPLNVKSQIISALEYRKFVVNNLRDFFESGNS